MDCIHLTQNGDRWRAVECGNASPSFIKCMQFLDYLRTCQLPKKKSAPWSRYCVLRYCPYLRQRTVGGRTIVIDGMARFKNKTFTAQSRYSKGIYLEGQKITTNLSQYSWRFDREPNRKSAPTSLEPGCWQWVRWPVGWLLFCLSLLFPSWFWGLSRGC